MQDTEISENIIDFEKIVTIVSHMLIVGLMVYLFIRLNNNVMELINRAYADDVTRELDHRLITPNVIVSLIGATAAQVGVSIVAIIKWLFPEK